MRVQLQGSDILVLPDGEIIKHKSPVYGGARELIARGHDPNEIIEVYRGETLCFHPAKLAWFAQWSVTDPAGGRISRSKWAPHPLAKDGEETYIKIQAALAED